MKTDNKIKMFAVAATVLATAACTDTWDEHYGNEGRPVRSKGIWATSSRYCVPRMCLTIINRQT